MGLNRKAMFFTIIAIIVLSLFFLSYSIYFVGKERKTINIRIENMNNFVYSSEQDLKRELYVSGYRIIFLTEKNIVDKGAPINNISATFNEAFLYGTINGQPEPIMYGATFTDINNRLFNNARTINLNSSLNFKKVIITQEDAWNIKLILTVDVLIQDKTNLALWNKTENYTVYIPIDNFEDPLYVIYTNGLVTNKINKTIYSNFVSGYDVTNLSLHNQNSYYIASSLGPSFLDRLEGKTSANQYGIESLIYLPKLSSQGITIKDISCVDYIYFSSNYTESKNIQGMPYWFRIDTAHLNIYNVSGIIV